MGRPIIATTCTIEECTRPYRALGFCLTHYVRYKKHGSPHLVERTNHGLSKTKAHSSWSAAKNRVFNKKGIDYHHYGGRGITMCDRWKNSFLSFLEDMGEPPSSKHTLDRIDNNGNYEPSNCRWATRLEQARNTRTNKLITYKGETKTESEWCRQIGISSSSFIKRLVYGWPIEKIINTPSIRTPLTDNDISQIISLRKQGYALKRIAKIYRRHYYVIREIVAGI